MTAPGFAARPAEQGAAARELETFKKWLDQKHPGYNCDAGPAQFRNAAVGAAYGGRRFYYVLTYPRGIRPPFGNALSLVARVGEDGVVQRLDLSDLATYRDGLKKVRKAADARQVASAVLVLSLGDPGQGRWPIKEEAFKVKKTRTGWVCTYPYDPNHASEIRFDKDGLLASIGGGPPPVP